MQPEWQPQAQTALLMDIHTNGVEMMTGMNLGLQA
ncbi:hypothetical protein BSPWISOXPB_9938 [uncultured Gammaproteobacteria bacterium]|nr:hypothetical protein BSPWISOXPB_9938 [uncultured Gammaproteobacteria bacterium]